MKKISIKGNFNDYVTTLQMRGMLPKGADTSTLQKYKKSGSSKTFYLKSDIEALLVALTSADPTPAAIEDKTEMTETEVVCAKEQKKVKDEAPAIEKLVLVAYVDGSFNKVTKVYGSAVIITDQEEKDIIAKKTSSGTKMSSMWNVAGEISAAALAVKLAEELIADELIIKYDCDAVAKWPTGQWGINDGVSRKYAEQYVTFMRKKRSFNITYEYVKAHSGNRLNEMADDMALSAAGLKTMKESFPEYTGTSTKIDTEVLAVKYQVTASCINGINAFYQLQKHAFKDYVALRAGSGDNFSRMWNEADFADILSEEERRYITSCLDDDRSRMNAMRWTARGLNANDAVRKAQVDQELFAGKR